MSIDKLREDLAEVTKRVPTGPLVTAADIGTFLHDDFLPLVESMVAESSEQDEVIGDLVRKTSEVLHTESAGVFAAIIEAGKVLVGELRTRVGNDRRVLTLIKEWTELAAAGEEILQEIVIPDDEDEDDEDSDESGDAPATEMDPSKSQ